MARTFGSFDELKAALMALGPEDQLSAIALTPELATEILAHDPVNRKVRSGQLIKLVREIEGGHWDPRKSPALRFLPTIRLADGQHRCRAVVETKRAVVVAMCIVPDTIGMDEGAGRTLVDHLQLSHNLDEERAQLVSVVTKALCHVKSAGNREYLQFFQEQESFIRECAEKPLSWLEDQGPPVTAIFKPSILAPLRARAIAENQEPAASVDQLLVDAISGGTTAPEGTARRALARQFYEAMENSFVSRKKGKRPQILHWLLAALKLEREGVIKNITTTRLATDRKPRKHNSPKTQAA